MQAPKIIFDWNRALLSYSFWFAVLGALTFLVPLAAWEILEMDLDPNLFGWMGFGFTLAAIVGRFVAQPTNILGNLLRIVVLALVVALLAISVANADTPGSKLQSPSYGVSNEVSEGAIMQLAVPLLLKWEGVRYVAYRDVVGVWTICSGTTRNVTKGMIKTAAQCEALVRAEALEYWHGVSAYLNHTAKSNMTPERGASWTSFAINVGIYGAGKSTATKRLNQGDVAGACEALTWWNKAGGKIYRGLTNRRSDEYRLCMIRVRA